jgi:gliding motility-associated-like protein
MIKLFTSLFTLLLFLLSQEISWAQEFEWVKRITRNVNTNHYRLTADGEGNVFLMGTFKDEITLGNFTFKSYGFSSYDDIFLAKYNPSGQVLWARHFGGYGQVTLAGADFLGSIALDSEGNCYVTGSFNGLFQINNFTYNIPPTYWKDSESYLIKFDKTGKVTWVKFLHGQNKITNKSLALDRAGNVYVAGNLPINNVLTAEGSSITASPNQESYLAKYTKDGDLLWLKSIGGSDNAIVIDKEGYIYLTGVYWEKTVFDTLTLNGTFSNGNYTVSSFITKYDSKGHALWAKPILCAGSNIEGHSINLDPSGSIYLMGRYDNMFSLGKDTLRNIIDSNSYIAGYNNVFLAQFDQKGNPVWAKRMVSHGIVSAGDIVVGSTGYIYFSGTIHNRGLIGEIPYGEDSKDGIFMGKISQSGKVEWLNHIYSSSFGTLGTTMSTDGKGSLFLAGQGGEHFGNIQDYGSLNTVFYTKIRDTTYIIPNKVRGKVYDDSNKNCLQDPGEEPLAYHLLKAEPGPYYASTDHDGNYIMELPKGSFKISQINNTEGILVKQHCPINNGSHSVNLLSQGKDTTGFDFGNEVTHLPLLKVNVASDRVRRCFRSSTTVRYSNTGHAPAHNVEIKVYYPSYVVPISANMAYSRNDSLLTFTIGTLQPGQFGSISIADSVICGNEAIRGLTQCVKAVITPANSKPIDNRWDGSDVELKAVCKENGLVRLSIYNSGRADMADSAAYRIYLDAVKVYEALYMLKSGDSLSLQVPANGRTLRLEADLRPYHPNENRKPSITLEGCGGIEGIKVSKGFVNSLPTDDAAEEVSISCLPILDSFDPNDKGVTPEGVGPEKIVLKDSPLEYLIRFQNTGSDLAYKVVVVDTLDAVLDIASFEIGAASHAFTYSVSGQGNPVLTWTFSNINLPDSTTNEPGSHGYVRFRIRPRNDTPDGVKITNRAAIFFDYNSPVITNSVVNTTGQLPQDTHRTLAVDLCKDNYPTKAVAGIDTVIYEVSSLRLKANRPSKGFGYWKLISGKGIIIRPWDPETEVNELGAGKNVFEWNITLCDSMSRSMVTIERVVIPSKPQVRVPAPFCPDENRQQLSAQGINIRWYADASLQKKIAEGESYQASFERTDTLYITQTIDGYESLPALLPVVIKPIISMPEIEGAGYLCNGMLLTPLKASGEEIRWYSDESLKKLLHEGKVFDKGDIKLEQLFVTQTSNGCTSQAMQVVLLAGSIDLKERVKIPNVITPNGDGANDAFLLPEFEENTCIGKFLSIRIYNRWGKVVFTSNDPAFSWNAQGLSSGIYYYDIRYNNFTAGGGLSVLY